MQIYEKITVVQQFPERIFRLNDLAYNLWWSWNHRAIKVFEMIDCDLWEQSKHNPISFLQKVSNSKLQNAANNEEYLNLYDSIVIEFDNYINNDDTWFSKNYSHNKDYITAYFCAEYGLHESLPIYSGGLGVLAGDHCKSASDLGLPFVAIGLLYKHGYFQQHLNKDGWQEAKFIDYNLSELPIEPVIGSDGKNLIISVDFPGRNVYCKVWETNIGRVKLYLLDTDISQNSNDDKQITYTLYGGNQETRISQEIVLGIGGIRLLDSLNIKPSIFHLNEGHSAFCTLEFARKLVENYSLSFETAQEVIRAATVFTTHTPVPAGSDRFPVQLIDKYLSNLWKLLGINREHFLSLGIDPNSNDQNVFNMTILALKMSGLKNGVSKLHGLVSRNIFNSLWKEIPEGEVPISHVTNGIHTLTWVNSLFKSLYDKYLGKDWVNNIDDLNVWEKINDIPNAELWSAHMAIKQNMICFIRDRLKKQKKRNGEPYSKINTIDSLFGTNALTIGFARRFATYKRAMLIFRDLPRLKNILHNPAMPTQLVFSGKAHPADHEGQYFIKQIYDLSQHEDFKGKIFLVENYDMETSRHLVAGVDVWLNNPRRPLEASGTSGEKAALNGVVNFSVLDGWWAEGYNGFNGWVIGNEDSYFDSNVQDGVDSEWLYSTLEQEIVPLFYERDDDNIPIEWIKRMKSSIISCAPVFSSDRMLKDYINNFYIPTGIRLKSYIDNHFNLANELSKWKSNVFSEWDHLKIIYNKLPASERGKKVFSGRPFDVNAIVYLGNLQPDNVSVEIYYGKIGSDGYIENASIKTMNLTEKCENNHYKYSSTIYLDSGGEYGYTFRMYPYHPALINNKELGLIKVINK